MTYRDRGSDHGQMLISAAVMITVLFGFMGLVIDAGYFFDQRKVMQTAADSAALAGALEAKRNPAGTDYVPFARQDATLNGFTHGQEGIAVQVNRPPLTGFSAGNTKAVEVIITQPQPTYFMQLLDFNALTVAARAVASPGPSQGCVYVLRPTGSATFKASTTSTLTMPNCNLVVNSDSATAASISGDASVTAASVIVTGNYKDTSSGDFVPTPVTGVPPEADPLSDLPVPTWGACDEITTVTFVGGTHTLDPGVYCGGFKFSGGANVTFNPGTYILQGKGFESVDSQVSGTEVFFYNDAGSSKFTIVGGTAALSAPTSGTYEGILFFQSRLNVAKAVFSQGGNVGFEGTLYLPAAEVQYSGGSTTTADYTVIISSMLEMKDGSTINTDFSSLANGSPIKRISLSE